MSSSDCAPSVAGTRTVAACCIGGTLIVSPAAAARTTTAASRLPTCAGRPTRPTTSGGRRRLVIPDLKQGPRRMQPGGSADAGGETLAQPRSDPDRDPLTGTVLGEDAPDLADHGGVALAQVAGRHEDLGRHPVEVGAVVGDEAVAAAGPGRVARVRDDGMGRDPRGQPQL